jgi:histidine ammonia-lyase
MATITRDGPLHWRDIAAIADGADLELSPAAFARIAEARAIVEAIVAQGIRAYGVTTGVGALSEVVVDRSQQNQLSHNIIMSHATGVGAPIPLAQVRAIIAAQINNHAHGYSGVRPETVEVLRTLLVADCIPEVPSKGSVGYLTHMAHIALILLGEGFATFEGERLSGAQALGRIGLAPLTLEAKEGLSLVNGTPCATGLACVALARAEKLFGWADAIAAMSFENLRGQIAAFDETSLALRQSPGLQAVGKTLRDLLAGSEILAAAEGKRTQDPLSLRAVPHVHGAARDVFEHVAKIVDQELASVTDNPAIGGTPEAPKVFSEAHAVSPTLGLAMDTFAVAIAEIAAMSERRIDRLINPLVSGLPAFLAADSGVASGFMIAQYTAVALVNDNRRLAEPASLDGGITSALQEDHLSHATPAAAKAHAILDNAEAILGIELLAAAQAYDLQPANARRAQATDRIYQTVRRSIGPYADNRPLAPDIESARALIQAGPP